MENFQQASAAGVLAHAAPSVVPPLPLGAQVSVPADAALTAAASPDNFIVLTFGNAAISDHLQNFVAHVQSAGISHVVGVVDVAAACAGRRRSDHKRRARVGFLVRAFYDLSDRRALSDWWH